MLWRKRRQVNECQRVGGISQGLAKNLFYTHHDYSSSSSAQLISSPHFCLALALANSRPAQHKQQLQGS
jgi:hypothetical protein